MYISQRTAMLYWFSKIHYLSTIILLCCLCILLRHIVKNASFFYDINSKAIPLQNWTGPECCSSLRIPDCKTIGTWRRYCM